MRLRLLKGSYAICRLAPGSPLPDWPHGPEELFSVTVTPEEVSVVCPTQSVPAGVHRDGGWAVLKVEGPLPLEMTGVLASLVVPISEADIAVFAVSTFDTDYLLVKLGALPVVKAELENLGHCLRLPGREQDGQDGDG